MAYYCEYCQKGIQAGHNIKHHRGVAGGRWKRKAQKTLRNWRPNLHNVRVIEDGKVVRRRLCTKCLRRANRPHLQEQVTTAERGKASNKLQETTAERGKESNKQQVTSNKTQGAEKEISTKKVSLAQEMIEKKKTEKKLKKEKDIDKASLKKTSAKVKAEKEKKAVKKSVTRKIKNKE